MKKLIIASLSALVLVVGGSAAGVSAQEVGGEPEIVVDNPEPAPGDTVNVGVGNLEPETEVGVELGDEVSEGVADADGNASIDIKVPDDPGEIDGIVNINGVDYPISVVVAAVAEAEAEGEGEAEPEATPAGDGTPQPTAVNTGDASNSSSNSAALFAAAAGLLVVGGGAMTIRRRSTMS